MTLWTKAASLEARPAGSSWNFRPSACQVSKDWDWIAGLLEQALMGLGTIRVMGTRLESITTETSREGA